MLPTLDPLVTIQILTLRSNVQCVAEIISFETVKTLINIFKMENASKILKERLYFPLAPSYLTKFLANTFVTIWWSGTIETLASLQLEVYFMQ